MVITRVPADTITTSVARSFTLKRLVASLRVTHSATSLTAVVLSYDGIPLLETILPTIAAQRGIEFKTIVVDNGSSDGTEAWLAKHWPAVEVVRLPTNVGVTPALNVCLRAADTEFVALLNNDLELEPDALARLTAALVEHPDAASAGAKLIDFHDRAVLDGAGDVFTWAGTGGRRGHGQLDRGQYDSPQAIFGACGGAAVYRKAAVEDIGEFDESFFAFYEDVDWALRAQVLGWGCRYEPGAVVYHMGSATIGKGLTDFTRYHLWRNGLWIVAKNYPVAALVRYFPWLLLGQAVNFAVALRDRKLHIWARVVRDALKGLPAVLRQRRVVQSKRRASLKQLQAVVGPEG
jgi:GT2 family glycosyltransferase